MRKKMNAWQSGLLATSALAAVFFIASLLWQQGLPHWAFVLAFAVVWVLISISWANADYLDESGSILARIVDQNFDHMHERVHLLERELEELREKASEIRRIAS